jgi:hypothetical protein
MSQDDLILNTFLDVAMKNQSSIPTNILKKLYELERINQFIENTDRARVQKEIELTITEYLSNEI